MAEIAAALAALINNSSDPDAAAFTAAANGADLYIVNRDGIAFVASPSFSQAAVGSASESLATPVSMNVTSSTVAASETWVLKLSAGSTVNRYSFTVKATGTTLQAVLDGLAATLNADSASPYTAAAGSASLLIFRSGSVGFEASLAVEAAGAAAIDPATARTATVTLTGKPVAGETWKLELAGRTYSLVAGPATSSLAAIAENLAGQVNDDGNAAAFTATGVAGATLTSASMFIVNRDGTTFAAQVSVEPATPQSAAAVATQAGVDLFGRPLAGEVWTVTLAGRDYAVVVDATTNTLDKIATALADAIRR
ncbi:MAG: hypothetical protein IPK39_05820 [Sulfuritalea sp.]|nr:hypothetical protein [Sulfuritalea sp.]